LLISNATDIYTSEKAVRIITLIRFETNQE